MPPAPHILFLNEFFHPDICASAAVLTDRLPRLARRQPDWKITVLASNRAWDSPSVIYPREEEFGGVTICRIDRPAVSRTNLLRRALGFAVFSRGAVRAARHLPKLDLVVGTTAPPNGADIAHEIARRHGCPYIYTVLDLYPDLTATLERFKTRGLIYRRWLARDTKLMQGAAAVVSIAERITERIAATRDVPRSLLHTIHDGFDPARITVGSAVRTTTEATGVRTTTDAGDSAPAVRTTTDSPGNTANEFAVRYNPDGRFVIQYAGNMGLSHPFDTILAAARTLTADTGLLFQFIGDGPQRVRIQTSLPPNAQLIGYQPADLLGEVLSAADICLISQHAAMFDQALPYKIYATLAAGKPCIFIGNRRCEIVDWLEQANCGLHVDQGDADRLAAVIRELKADPPRLRAMSAAARALFDARFHADQTAAQWAGLLAGILARRTEPGP